MKTKANKANATVPAFVEEIIKPRVPGGAEKAQIAIQGADHYYREIRVENSLTDSKGRKVGLKPGAEIEVTLEADTEATTPKS